VTASVRDTVLRRDQGCVAPRLGAVTPCRGRWGEYPPRSLELDHVKDQPRMGVRAPSDPAHLISMCRHHHETWATANRPALREYLRRVEGMAA
jgi:hypothetical protein